MYQVINQEDKSIEIALSGHITGDEFKEVLHQLESLCRTKTRINVLIDAVDVEKFDRAVLKEEHDFYEKYKIYLDRIAFVSDSTLRNTIVKLFDFFRDTDTRTFTTDHIKEAREWTFPSKLP